MSRRIILEPYDLHRGPQALGSVWAARCGTRDLYCALFTHPHGWELRLRLDRGVTRTHVCRTPDDVFSVSEHWRTEVASPARTDGRDLHRALPAA